MRCPFCKTQSDAGIRRCPTCGVGFAVPDDAPRDVPGLGLMEGFEYPAPSHHYRTQDLSKLQNLIEDYLEGEEVWDEAMDHLESMKGYLSHFLGERLPSIQATLVEQAAERPDEAYDFQLSYLLSTGTRAYGQGCEDLANLLEEENEDDSLFEKALSTLQDGVDYLAFCLELMEQRKAQLEERISAHPETEPES